MFTRRQLLKGMGGLALAAGWTRTSHAKGGIHEVQMRIEPVEGRPVPEFFYEPTGLYLEPGDTVRWIAGSPHHTVTAYHRMQGKSHRVPEGVEPFSSPVVPIGGVWEYTFNVPGVYDYWCAPHEQYGMAGRLVVGFPQPGPAMEPAQDFGPNGTFGAAGAVLNDPALRAVEVFFRGAVSWYDLDPASKQLSDACAPEAHD